MSAPDATTAAPNNAALPSEVSGVVPSSGGTTDAPNNTSLAGEVPTGISGSGEKRLPTEPSTVGSVSLRPCDLR